MTDVERLNAMQDHVHDGDDVGEGLLLLAVEGFALAEFSSRPHTVRERLGISAATMAFTASLSSGKLDSVPTTRMSELSAQFPGQWRLAQAARIRAYKNELPILRRACGPRNAHESRKESAFKLRSLQQFLIQSADVVQDQRSRTNSTHCCLSRNE